MNADPSRDAETACNPRIFHKGSMASTTRFITVVPRAHPNVRCRYLH